MTKAKNDSQSNENKIETGEGVDTHVPTRSERANMKSDDGYEAAKTGAVLDSHDGRLKENRDKGITLGTTAHSATGNVQRDEPKSAAG